MPNLFDTIKQLPLMQAGKVVPPTKLIKKQSSTKVDSKIPKPSSHKGTLPNQLKDILPSKVKDNMSTSPNGGGKIR